MLLVVLPTAEVFDGLAVLQNRQGVQLADVMLLAESHGRGLWRASDFARRLVVVVVINSVM